MDDKSVHKYRADFERVMRSKAEAWGFDPEEELDYWNLTINEQEEHPLRGNFDSYVKQSTAQLFSIFCAGAKNEKLRQAKKKARKKALKKFCTTPPMPDGFFEQRAFEKRETHESK